MKLNSAYKHCKNAVKHQIPLMLWGPPGIGKSSIVHQIVSELGCNVEDLRLAQLEPTDLRGVPMPNRESGRAEWYLPAFWPERSKEAGEREAGRDEDGNPIMVSYKAGECPDGPGIIFLDEIEKAPVSVKNAALQLVLDRKIGAYKLPDDWAMICAGNREEDNCFSQPLGDALSNRMTHIEVEADVIVWSEWARNHGVVDDIIAFLTFRQDLLIQQTDDHAFPTPRSWDMASRLIKEVKPGSREQKELLQASVGTAAATEFAVWQQVYRNVDPEAVFQGKMPDLENEEASFKYAVALAVAFHLRNRKGGIKGAEDNIAKFLSMLGTELRVIVLRQLSLHTLEIMMKHKAFASVVKDMMSIVV